MEERDFHEQISRELVVVRLSHRVTIADAQCQLGLVSQARRRDSTMMSGKFHSLLRSLQKTYKDALALSYDMAYLSNTGTVSDSSASEMLLCRNIVSKCLRVICKHLKLVFGNLCFKLAQMGTSL